VTLTATVTDQADDDLSGATVGFSVDPGASATGTSPAAMVNVCSDAELSYNPATHDNIATCSYTPESAGPYGFFVEYRGYGQYEESGAPGVYITVT
jgi:hypothetical protein